MYSLRPSPSVSTDVNCEGFALQPRRSAFGGSWTSDAVREVVPRTDGDDAKQGVAFSAGIPHQSFTTSWTRPIPAMAITSS